MVDFYFYRGLYKVKALTQTEGYWVVEALEDFDDYLNGEKVAVKTGEQRIVPTAELYSKKTLSPPIPEHTYERKLEKELKKMLYETDPTKTP